MECCLPTNLFAELVISVNSAMRLMYYSKAFDTINHHIMSSMLHFIGCLNETISLLCFNLSDRTKFEKANARISKMSPIYRSVPQGSILGLQLFCINICHLIKDLTNVKVHKYADDTQIS